MKLFNALNPLNSSRANFIGNDCVIGQIELNIHVLTVGIAFFGVLIILLFVRHYLALRTTKENLFNANQHLTSQNHYLQETLTAFEESNEENIRALQVIAHDLRSPMAAIVGLSGFMIQEHTLNEEDLEVLSLIHTSGEDSLKFINEVLDRNSALAEIKKENVAVHKLLAYCVAQLQYKANEKEQEIKLYNLTVNANLNREKIWRVVNNLITNAIKFSPPKSTIAVELKSTDQQIVISVKDNGIGIPEELQEKIFSPDQQRKRTGTAGEKSFGLGLAMAKKDVELHGGSLTFTSEIGKGSVFSISLPLLKDME